MFANGRIGQRDAVARAMQLVPEMALLAAMLRQVLEDAQSSSEAIREEASTSSGTPKMSPIGTIF